jgi:hypothetical protein
MATDKTPRVTSQRRNLLPRRHRPHLHLFLPTSRNNMLPIKTEGDRPNFILVSSHRRNLLPARHRPHLHQGVITSRNNMLPIGTKGDRYNIVCMSSQRQPSLRASASSCILNFTSSTTGSTSRTAPHQHQQKVKKENQ